MDKAFAIKLTDAIEAVLLDNLSMRRYLDEVSQIQDNLRKHGESLPKFPDSGSVILSTRINLENKAQSRKAVRPLRQAIERNHLERVAQQALEVLKKATL
jgi:hypothetical protein